MTNPTADVNIRRIQYQQGHDPFRSPIVPVFIDDTYDALGDVDVLDPVMRYDPTLRIQGYHWNGVEQVPDGSVPFSDNFSRADAPLGNNWIGSTWNIVSGKAINTPSLGSDIITNGSFSVDTSGWTAASSVLASIAGGQSGNNLRITNNATAVGGARQQLITILGTWYLLDLYHKDGTAAGALIGGLSAGTDEILPSNYVAFNNAAWTRRLAGFHAPSTSAWFDFNVNSNVSGSTTNYDEIIVKPLTGLYAIRQAGQINLNIQGTYSVLNSWTQLGVLANVAYDFSAGIVAWVDGVNIRLEKWVGTTWTTLINTAQTLAASKLPQIKTHRSGINLLVDLLYDGSAVGTQQIISDAQIINNMYYGMFSTYSGNSIATISADAY